MPTIRWHLPIALALCLHAAGCSKTSTVRQETDTGTETGGETGGESSTGTPKPLPTTSSSAGSTTSGDPTTTAGTSGEGETGDGSCVANEDCWWDEVCDTDGQCVYGPLAAFQMQVTWWDPPSCYDGVASGVADLYWALKLDGSWAYTSDWKQRGCPGSWTEVACLDAGVLLQAFELHLWDEDEPWDDDLVDGICWVDPDDPDICVPFPELYLNEGGYFGETNPGGELYVEFEVVSGCG